MEVNVAAAAWACGKRGGGVHAHAHAQAPFPLAANCRVKP